MSILGLDIGTTGTKAVAFDLDGRCVASAYREYDLLSPRPGHLELNPAEVVQAIKEVVGKVAARTRTDPIRSVAFSTLGEAVIPVDAKNRPLANAIIGFDSRGAEQCRQFRRQIGEREVFNITGHAIDSYHSIFKILHWKRHDPAVFNHAARFLCFPDYVAATLGLPPVIDHSMASRTLMFDVRRRCWSDRILSMIDLPPDRLAQAAAPGELIGRIGRNDFGLPDGCVLAAGLHDQPAGILGAGIQPAEAMYAIGTVVCVGVRIGADGGADTSRTAPSAAPDPDLMRANHFCYYPTYGHEQYVSLAWNPTGGSLLKWYRDTLAQDQLADANQRGLDPYDLILAELPLEPTNLFVLPHFTMTGTPWMEPNAAGAIWGLRLTTKRAEIVRAVLEGITYEVRLNQSLLAEAGVDIKVFKAIGGAAKSDAWMQITADILNRPVAVLGTTEAASLGSALLGAKAADLVDDVEAAAARFANISRLFEPGAGRAAEYERRFDIYRQLYPATCELARQLAALNPTA